MASRVARLRDQLQGLLEGSGIVFNGTNPWDPQIKDERFYARVLSEGSLGLGESYMDGWWECGEIDELVARLLRQHVDASFARTWPVIKNVLLARFMNLQSSHRAFMVGQAHYDVGNDLYQAMLGEHMAYTCGYWKSANTLDAAQAAKLDLVCRKIGLKSGQRVLDIGCGWGSFAKFAAEKYGATVVGITVSKEQVKLARERCAGLPIEIRLQDYRDVNEPFDHIISLGMFEHVGVKNYRTYFEVARRCLKDDGLFLLHTIGGNISSNHFEPWMEKYIFPNAMLPSATQIAEASERLFVMEDWHTFGPDYDKTLMAWYRNVESRWSTLSHHADHRFHRMWRYYLLSCAGTFRARKNQLWQIIFSAHGMHGGVPSIR